MAPIMQAGVIVRPAGPGSRSGLKAVGAAGVSYVVFGRPVRGVLACVLVLAGVFCAGALPASSTQLGICRAIATADHLKPASTCPGQPSGIVSFTVPASAPAGFEATVAYSIMGSSALAQVAWQYDASGGPETTLPIAGRVPGTPGPSYLYLAPGQDDAEATTRVGTAIVDVILVPASGKQTASLRPTIEALLLGAARLVRAAEAEAAG
jgi:hypothetical protein